MTLTAVLAGCSPPTVPLSAPDDTSANLVKQEDDASFHDSVGETSPAERTDQSASNVRTTSGATATIPRLFRIANEPLELNPRRLEAAGIHVLESPRLILLTDRDPDSVRELLHLADLFFHYLQRECGPLRDSESGEEFKAIGCLMVDFERFESVGLVPDSVVDMQHGEQFGYRFWLRDQKDDYYRSHLLLHEFAHVYMTCDTGLGNIPDGWFMEGAAEVFATHNRTDELPSFGLLPGQFAGFEGWGRISTIRRNRIDRVANELTRQSIPALHKVQFPEGPLARADDRYAWWWALSWMLANHPDYVGEWQSLCHLRGANNFRQQTEDLFDRLGDRLSVDWLLFAETLSEHFDTERSFPLHREPSSSSPKQLTLRADRSWQDTGWMANAGDTVTIECSGACVVAQTTAPWVSQPNGITLEYNQGRPLGEVVAVFVNGDEGRVSRRIAIGDARTLTANRPGRLWLQINDDAGMRSDNSGCYSIAIQPPVAANNDAKR
jgi:hypothetical protein